MKKPSLHRMICTGALLLLLPASFQMACAAPIFFDDFDYPKGQKSGTMGSWSVTNPDATRSFSVVGDDGDMFHRGADNNYVSFSNTGNSTMAMTLTNVLPTGNYVVTVSFNWIFPELAGNTRPFSMRVGVNGITGDDIGNILSFARTTSEGKRVGSVTIAGGENALFDLGTPYRFDIVFNNSAETITYENGTLASRTYDIWINGTRVASGLQSLNRYEGDITSLTFRTDSNSPNLAYLDWVAVYSGAQVMAAIPEPSALTLLGAATTAAGAVLLIRKRKSI